MKSVLDTWLKIISAIVGIGGLAVAIWQLLLTQKPLLDIGYYRIEGASLVRFSRGQEPIRLGIGGAVLEPQLLTNDCLEELQRRASTEVLKVKGSTLKEARFLVLKNPSMRQADTLLLTDSNGQTLKINNILAEGAIMVCYRLKTTDAGIIETRYEKASLKMGGRSIEKDLSEPQEDSWRITYGERGGTAGTYYAYPPERVFESD